MHARHVLPVVVAAATAVLLAPPASAAPPQPACGDTLTADTALRADLTCASAPGLRLAPGVTLDLRGHALRGPGTGVGVAVASEGAVTVRNGTVTGWSLGVETVVVEDTTTGPLAVDRVTFRDNGTGLDVSGTLHFGGYAKPTTVTRSTFQGNGSGVTSDWMGSVVAERSTFTENDRGVTVGEGEAVVRTSTFVRNGVGVTVYGGYADVSGSTFLDNPVGVRAGDTVGAVGIADSRFTGSQVAVEGGSVGLSVSGTRFVSNTTAVQLSAYHSEVTDSTFRANGTGITAASASPAGLLRGNVLRLNGDGIVVEGADTGLEVGDNDVRRSTRWGIHVPGVTDLGGNVARGNGNEPQCVGVVCDGRPRS